MDSAVADVDWRDGVPVSHRFQDPYFSLAGGLAETQYVFLTGNGLPERFRDGFRIGELGFGTGLNLLAAWTAWQQAGAPGRLDLISFEAFAMAPDDRTRALAAWPALDAKVAALNAALRMRAFGFAPGPLPGRLPGPAAGPLPGPLPGPLSWPLPGPLPGPAAGPAAGPLPGLLPGPAPNPSPDPSPDPLPGPSPQPMALGDGVYLTLIAGDARDTLPRWSGQVDAWFLDGFAPARNPQMWEPALLMQVADRLAPGGTLATYTAAGAVRRALADAGLEVARVPGYGRKRHMTTARKPGPAAEPSGRSAIHAQ